MSDDNQASNQREQPMSPAGAPGATPPPGAAPQTPPQFKGDAPNPYQAGGQYAPPQYEQRPSGLESLIPTKNPMALTSYYLGVFTLIPGLGLILGPAAVVFGGLGVAAYKRDSRVGGLGHAITGLVLGGAVFLLQLIVVIMMFSGM